MGGLPLPATPLNGKFHFYSWRKQALRFEYGKDWINRKFYSLIVATQFVSDIRSILSGVMIE